NPTANRKDGGTSSGIRHVAPPRAERPADVLDEQFHTRARGQVAALREGHLRRPRKSARVAQSARQHVEGPGPWAPGHLMTQWSSPPPAARWLLERALPNDVRESVTGDLDEVF